MKEILEMSKTQRAQIFQEAAAQSGKLPIIIEKDFWVCWSLDQVFAKSTISSKITFKGGTSLSKCYGIIDRFSEDCDLTIDKGYIGITPDNDPASAETPSKRNKRLEQLSASVKSKINTDLKPLLNEVIKTNLSPYFKETEWSLETDSSDEQCLVFNYPRSSENQANEYIQDSIRLEFGARGDNSPWEIKIISPYIQQILPSLFNNPSEIKVTTLTAMRTFWEKVTLLHAEYHRTTQANGKGH